jgi:predicted MFS family arabinose efflux permease
LASAALLLGNGIGPAVGGALIEHLGWPTLLPSLLALNGAALLLYVGYLGTRRLP